MSDDVWRLNDALEEAGLVALDVEPDGNCMFRSVADQLWGDESHHAEVREAAVDTLAAHRQELEFLADREEGEEWDAYLDQMARSGVFGDAALLVAAGISYGRDVVVVMTHGVEHYQVEMFAPATSLDDNATNSAPFWLLLHNHHYLSVRELDNDEGPAAVPAAVADEVEACLSAASLGALDGQDVQLESVDDEYSDDAFHSDVHSESGDEEDADNDVITNRWEMNATPMLPESQLSDAALRDLHNTVSKLWDIVKSSASIGFGWHRVLTGEIIFNAGEVSREDLARDALINGFLSFANPALLELLLPSATGGPMPSAEDLASIGQYTLENEESSMAYFKVALRKDRTASWPPDLVSVGHTSRPRSRRQQHQWKMDNTLPADGFQNMWLAHRDKYDAVIFVAALLVPRTLSRKSNGCATLLAHYTEGLLTQWLGTLTDLERREDLAIARGLVYPFTGGNLRFPFAERPATVAGQSHQERLAWNRRRYRNMSPQKKAALTAKYRIWWDSLSTEEKEKRRLRGRLGMRERRANLSDAQKEKVRQAAAKRWADRGPEGRKEANRLNTIYRQNEPEEKKERRRERNRKRGVERNAEKKIANAQAIGVAVPTTRSPVGFGLSFQSLKFDDLVVTDWRKAALEKEARDRGVHTYLDGVPQMAEALGVFIPYSKVEQRQVLEKMVVAKGEKPNGGRSRLMKQLGLDEATVPKFHFPAWAKAYVTDDEEGDAPTPTTSNRFIARGKKVPGKKNQKRKKTTSDAAVKKAKGERAAVKKAKGEQTEEDD